MYFTEGQMLVNGLAYVETCLAGVKRLTNPAPSRDCPAARSVRRCNARALTRPRQS